MRLSFSNNATIVGAVLLILLAQPLQPVVAAGQQTMEEAAAREWNIITVELTPGAMDTRQFHPGVELVYVIEGSGRLELDGELPVALEPGTISAFLPRQLHMLKNTSQTEMLKVLIVF